MLDALVLGFLRGHHPGQNQVDAILDQLHAEKHHLLAGACWQKGRKHHDGRQGQEINGPQEPKVSSKTDQLRILGPAQIQSNNPYYKDQHSADSEEYKQVRWNRIIHMVLIRITIVYLAQQSQDQVNQPQH